MANIYKIKAFEGDNLTENEYLALLYAANSGRNKGYRFINKSDGVEYIIFNNEWYKDEVKIYRPSDKKHLKARVLGRERSSEIQPGNPMGNIYGLLDTLNNKMLNNMIMEEEARERGIAAKYGKSESFDYERIRAMINDSVNTSIPAIVDKVVSQLRAEPLPTNENHRSRFYHFTDAAHAGRDPEAHRALRARLL